MPPSRKLKTNLFRRTRQSHLGQWAVSLTGPVPALAHWREMIEAQSIFKKLTLELVKAE